MLLLTGILTAGLFAGVKKNTALAATNDEIDYTDSIYYFSDSEPLLTKNEIAALGDYAVYYEVHYLTSGKATELSAEQKENVLKDLKDLLGNPKYD